MIQGKKFIISVIGVFIANLVIFIAWFYFFTGISREKIATQNLYKEVEVAERKLNNSRSLSNALSSIKNKEEKISATFLNSKNFVELIKKLEFISQKSGTELIIEAVKLPDLSSAEKPQFDFQVNGSFKDIFHFLSLFENLPYKINVEELNIEKHEIDKKNTWQTNFKIRVLSYQNT